jgi:hypothetical protein
MHIPLLCLHWDRPTIRPRPSVTMVREAETHSIIGLLGEEECSQAPFLATAHQASATGPDGQATTHNQPSAVIRRRIVSVSPFPYLFTRRLSWHLLDLVLSPLNYFLVRSITLSYIRTAETRGVEMSTPFAASFRCVPLSALRDVGLAGRSSTARGALNFLGCVAVHMTVSMGMLELMFRGYSWFTQTPPRWTRIIDVRK